MSDAFGERLGQAIAALAQRDLDPLAELLDPHVVWHVPGSADPIKTRDRVLEVIERDLLALDDVTPEVHDVLVNEHHAVALVHVLLRRGDGAETAYDSVEVIHHRDGRIDERWAVVDDLRAVRGFWLG